MSLKYVGGGYLIGVPARDLTDEEVKQHGRDRLLDSGFYIKVHARKPRPSETKVMSFGGKDDQENAETDSTES